MSSYTSNILRLLAEAERKAAGVVERRARLIEAGAEARSRVDTGAMRAGWSASPRGEMEWQVVNSVSYAIYHEFGTRHMGARPMVIPAAEDARAGFAAAIRRAYEQ